MISHTGIIVRYAETDMMGIVHHSIYPVWYEAARTDFIKHLGMTYSEMENMGVMLPLVELTSKYIGTAKYEDELDVAVKVQKLTPARIEFYYEVYNKKNDKLLNTGTTTHAWVRSEDFSVINMKKLYPEIFSAIKDSTESESK